MRRDQHSDRRRVRQYVTVILQLAGEADSWETWDRDLEILNSVASSRAVRTLITRPGTPLRERRDTLEGIVGNLLSAEGLALSRVLLEDGVFDLFPTVRAQYLRRSSQDGPVDRVTISGAVPLTDDETRRLLESLRQPDRKLLVEFEEDPEILGGLVIRQGDWRRDLSVSARLDALEMAIR